MCVKNEENCPITWIKWANNLEEVERNKEKFNLTETNVTVKASQVPGNPGYLMFSKAVDSLPVTSIKMLQKKPCFDPNIEVVSDDQ